MKKKPVFALWQWGLFLIVMGGVGNILAGIVLARMLAAPEGSDAARGQAFGRGFVTVLAAIAGVALIVLHFVRRNRR